MTTKAAMRAANRIIETYDEMALAKSDFLAGLIDREMKYEKLLAVAKAAKAKLESEGCGYEYTEDGVAVGRSLRPGWEDLAIALARIGDLEELG